MFVRQSTKKLRDQRCSLLYATGYHKEYLSISLFSYQGKNLTLSFLRRLAPSFNPIIVTISTDSARNFRSNYQDDDHRSRSYRVEELGREKTRGHVCSPFFDASPLTRESANVFSGPTPCLLSRFHDTDPMPTPMSSPTTSWPSSAQIHRSPS